MRSAPGLRLGQRRPLSMRSSLVFDLFLGSLRAILAEIAAWNSYCRMRYPLPTPGVCHGRGRESQQARHNPQ